MRLLFGWHRSSSSIHSRDSAAASRPLVIQHQAQPVEELQQQSEGAAFSAARSTKLNSGPFSSILTGRGSGITGSSDCISPISVKTASPDSAANNAPDSVKLESVDLAKSIPSAWSFNENTPDSVQQKGPLELGERNPSKTTRLVGTGGASTISETRCGGSEEMPFPSSLQVSGSFGAPAGVAVTHRRFSSHGDSPLFAFSPGKPTGGDFGGETEEGYGREELAAAAFAANAAVAAAINATTGAKVRRQAMLEAARAKHDSVKLKHGFLDNNAAAGAGAGVRGGVDGGGGREVQWLRSEAGPGGRVEAAGAAEKQEREDQARQGKSKVEAARERRDALKRENDELKRQLAAAKRQVEMAHNFGNPGRYDGDHVGIGKGDRGEPVSKPHLEQSIRPMGSAQQQKLGTGDDSRGDLEQTVGEEPGERAGAGGGRMGKEYDEVEGMKGVSGEGGVPREGANDTPEAWIWSGTAGRVHGFARSSKSQDDGHGARNAAVSETAIDRAVAVAPRPSGRIRAADRVIAAVASATTDGVHGDSGERVTSDGDLKGDGVPLTLGDKASSSDSGFSTSDSGFCNAMHVIGASRTRDTAKSTATTTTTPAMTGGADVGVDQTSDHAQKAPLPNGSGGRHPDGSSNATANISADKPADVSASGDPNLGLGGQNDRYAAAAVASGAVRNVSSVDRSRSTLFDASPLSPSLVDGLIRRVDDKAAPFMPQLSPGSTISDFSSAATPSNQFQEHGVEGRGESTNTEVVIAQRGEVDLRVSKPCFRLWNK